MNTPTIAQLTERNGKVFNGFYAVAILASGEKYGCRVVNWGTVDGQPVFRVKRVGIAGYSGWSGGCKPVYKLGEAHWVKSVQGILDTPKGSLTCAAR